MECDIEPDWQERCSSLDTQMKMFGATGGLRESAARHLMAGIQEHERTTPEHRDTIGHLGSFVPRSVVPSRKASRNVGGRYITQQWQYDMPTYDARNPSGNYVDYADSMMPTRADKYERIPPTQPAMGCNDQYRQASYCPSEPWNVSVLSNPQTYSHHRRNAVPTISIDSPNGENGVTGPRAAGGCTSYCNAAATTSTLSTYCLSEHEAQVEGWSGSYLSPETYSQASSSRRSSMGSIASAPSRLAVLSSDHTATPTEYRGWQSLSTSPNIMDPLEVQQPRCDRSVPSPSTGMSRETSAHHGARLYCSEPDCRATFQGSYAKGSLARHRRLKHGSHQDRDGREYDCEEPGCSKSYKRQDARLKHYRKVHRHLAPGPALSRTKYRSV